jgi:hypothetical protein
LPAVAPDLTLDFQQLFGQPGELPARLAICVASGALMRSITRGKIVAAASLVRDGSGALGAAPGGLFDEAAFGPAPRASAGGGIDLGAYQAPMGVRPQLGAFGAIRLPAPVLHPLARRLFLEQVAAACGLDVAAAGRVLAGEVGARNGQLAEGAELDAHDAADDGDEHDPADVAAVGAGALAMLARARGGVLPWVTTVIPVLPAGLRGPWQGPGAAALTYPWINDTYGALVGRLAAFDAKVASTRAWAARVSELQSLVDAFFLEGLAAAEGAASGAPRTRAAVDMLRTQEAVDGIASLGNLQGDAELAAALRGEHRLLWSCARALGLDIAGRLPGGAIDAGARARRHAAEASLAVQASCVAVLGEPRRAPARSQEGDRFSITALDLPGSGRLPPAIVTAGLSAAAIVDGGPCEELVCAVADALPDGTRQALAADLIALARGRAGLGPDREGATSPIVPGSALTRWCTTLSHPWTRLAVEKITGNPLMRLCVGVTEAEAAYARSHSVEDLSGLLGQAGEWPRTDPRRAEVGEHDVVWSTADGQGQCFYAHVAPLRGAGRVLWKSPAPTDESAELKKSPPRRALVASPGGIAAWRGGKSLEVLNPRSGKAVWTTTGGAPFPFTMLGRALYVHTDFGLMGFVVSANDVASKGPGKQKDHTLFLPIESKIKRGAIRLFPIANDLVTPDLEAQADIALPEPFASHEGPGFIAVGPGLGALAGPLRFGKEEWNTAGPRLAAIVTSSAVWADCGVYQKMSFLVADHGGKVLVTGAGSLRMADRGGALIDDDAGLSLYDASGQRLRSFRSCTPGAMSPELLVVHETFDDGQHMMVRMVAFDRATGERLCNLPVGRPALAGGGFLYLACESRICVFQPHKGGEPLEEIDVGQPIVAIASIVGGAVVRTARGDIIAVGAADSVAPRAVV